MVQSAQGEDRSSYQPVGPWTALDGSPLSFGFCKATEGTGWSDPTFADNWANLWRAKIPRGAYHFFHPSLSVTDQIDFFVSTVRAQGIYPGDMLMLDVEITSGADGTVMITENGARRSHLLDIQYTGSGLAPATVRPDVDYPHRHLMHTDLPPKFTSPGGLDLVVKEMLDGVTAAVVKIVGGDYCRLSCYTDLSMAPLLGSCTGYALFIADYTSSAPQNVSPWSHWDFWQYAGGGGNLGSDQDAYNGTAAELTAWIDAAKPHPQPPPPPPKDVSVTLNLPELSVGDTGGMVGRVQALLVYIGKYYGITAAEGIAIDGNFGPLTEAALKAVQQHYGLPVTGTVGAADWTMLYT